MTTGGIERADPVVIAERERLLRPHHRPATVSLRRATHHPRRRKRNGLLYQSLRAAVKCPSGARRKHRAAPPGGNIPPRKRARGRLETQCSNRLHDSCTLGVAGKRSGCLLLGTPPSIKKVIGRALATTVQPEVPRPSALSKSVALEQGYLCQKRFLRGLGAVMLLACAGCIEDGPSTGQLEAIWGRRGLSPGRLQKPRAMTVDKEDRLYLVDMTARIQVFTADGQYLHGWTTPEHKFGRPTGLSIDREGRVLVADTHYYRVLIYSPEGKLLETIGGTNGHEPGQFGWVTHVVEDSQGNLYISEYGEYDRIQKFDRNRKFVLQWGSHGSGPGQFVRPQHMAIDEQDNIWVADSGNSRVQVFDSSGRLVGSWGAHGDQPGQLSWPYDVALDGRGHVYVCEYGNHRVQKFTLDGRSLGCWGTHGRGPGEMHNPWGLVRDSRGKIYVLDTNNHRVQKITL